MRAIATAYIVSVGTLGGVLATYVGSFICGKLQKMLTIYSWTYLVRDAPRYPIGHSINLGAQIIVLCLASTGIAYNMRENRVRDAGKRNHRLEGLDEGQKRDLGHHHPEFRYIP